MEEIEAIWNKSLVTLSGGGQITVGQSVMVAVFLVVALIASRILGRMLLRLMRRKQIEPNVAQTIHRVFTWGLLILVVLTAMAMLQIPITALAFISGAVAVGVGFGAQNIINNLISSWILMSEKPVRVGDFVEIGTHTGVIERIGNRSTRIRRADNAHVLVPNSQLLEQTVVNWTLVDQRFRNMIRVGVAYGSPVRQVAELLIEAARAHPCVLAEPAPIAVFADFGDSALVFELHFWCEAPAGIELRVIRSDVRFTIERLLGEHGIEIAFPQRDLHLDTRRPLEIRLTPGTAAGSERT